MTIKLLCSEQVVKECLLPITVIETKARIQWLQNSLFYM
jgi:hypothetical protein